MFINLPCATKERENLKAVMADLCQAVKNADSRQVKVLLERGRSANYRCPDGVCPLHLACGLEETDQTVEIVKDLIEYGANVNYPSYDGLTPVHVAAIWGRSLTLSALLEHGGDAYLKDHDNMDSVQYAQESEGSSEACLLILKGFGFTADGKHKEFDFADSESGVETEEDNPFMQGSSDSVTNRDDVCYPNEEGFIVDREKSIGPCDSILTLRPSEKSCVNPIVEDSFSSAILANQFTHLAIHDCNLALTSSTKSSQDLKPQRDNLSTSNGQTTHILPQEQSPSKKRYNGRYGCKCDSCSPQKTEIVQEKECLWKEDIVTLPNLTTPDKNKVTQLTKDKPQGKTTHSSLKRHDMDRSYFEISVAYDWKDLTITDSTDDETQLISEELWVATDEQLRELLIGYGERIGPITKTTRNIYVRHLAKLIEGREPYKKFSRFDEYPPEIRSILSGGGTIEDGAGIEREMCMDFVNPDRHKWREGTRKTSFNYVLLDPRVTKDFPSRIRNLSSLEQFHSFVSAIFYLGKGKQSRPYEHLYETIKTREAHCKRVSDKNRVIQEIWSSGFGVVSLHVFHNIIPVEAYTREACMVDALGLQRLTNVKRGDYYGPAASWAMKKRRQLGTYLLQKALKVFIAEGEKQIREIDLGK